MKGIVEHLGAASNLRVFLYSGILTIIIESVTILMRFGFHLQSTRDTGAIGRLTFGYRIHHGYIGVLLLLAALLVGNVTIRKALWMIGLALVVSDLVHHFLVLWPFTGSHDFDIRYPDP